MTSHKVNLDGEHQLLIDLNGTNTNFACKFKILPAEGDIRKDYMACIATQTLLDNQSDLKYIPLSGIYEGSIKNTNNVYENYFLILNSGERMDNLIINVDCAELPVLENTQQEHYETRVSDREQVPEPALPKSKKYFKLVILAGLVIGGGYLIYYFSKKNKSRGFKY